MNKTLCLSALFVVVTGCSTIPDNSDIIPMPATSQLVLMAIGNNNAEDRTSNKYPISPNVTCNNVEDKKLNSNDIFSKVKTEAIEQKTGLTPEQIKQAADLLYSGQFRSDIRNLIILTISIIPDLAQTLPQSGAVIQNKIKDLKSKTQPENINQCIEAILGKHFCSDKDALHNLLNDLYHDPSSELVKATFLTLLDNQSFRLALIVYAHSNGVDINSADLDFVQVQLRKPDIDLDVLKDEGEKRLKEKYKIDEAETKINALTLRCK
ncbi:MAG: hypothetical protein RLZ75_1502 [Pseudomonadota bacterium]|jgi:hypothetical protein